MCACVCVAVVMLHQVHSAIAMTSVTAMVLRSLTIHTKTHGPYVFTPHTHTHANATGDCCADQKEICEMRNVGSLVPARLLTCEARCYQTRLETDTIASLATTKADDVMVKEYAQKYNYQTSYQPPTLIYCAELTVTLG
jgi:hypothetical protein